MRKDLNTGIRQFEWPLIHFTLWITVAAFAVALLLNFFFPEYDRRSNVVFSVGLAFMLVLIWLFKQGYAYRALKSMLISVMWITFNVSWFLNQGFNYSTIILFAFFFTFIVFIQNKRGIIVSSIGMVVNLTILIILNTYYKSEIFGESIDAPEQVDLIYTIVIGWAIIPTYILIAKTNYVKAYKRAQASEELKTSFLANMSHEIRTPLNAIMGFSELIKEEPELRNNEKYLEVIHGNSVYLHELIDQVLNISLIESGNLRLHRQEVSLSKLFSQLALEFATVIQYKKCDVAIEYQLENTDLIIHTDPVQLEQVFKNLLSNAIKFTDSGVIEFGVYEMQHDLLFFVSDTGKGIDPDELPTIFDRFVKGMKKEPENNRGVGLGLYLCKRIIQHLGGMITVDSELGVGTKFQFSLPK